MPIALHDMGKVNAGFQAKAWPDPVPLARTGHIGPILDALASGSGGEMALSARLQSSLLVSTMTSWFSGAEAGAADLLLAAFSHHGDMPTDEPSRFRLEFWRPVEAYDPLAEAERLCNALRGWLPMAFATGGDKLRLTHRFVHAMTGLISLADWLGSDRHWFPYYDRRTKVSDEKVRFAHSMRQAQAMLAARGLDPSGAMNAARSHPQEFRARFGFPPRPAQQAIGDVDVQTDAASLLLLEDETGAGKTEAALHHFLTLHAAGLVDGMYFAVPTRAAARQLQRRIRSIMQRALGAEAPPVGLAVPGYVIVDDAEARALPDFKVLWPDGRMDELRDRGWACENPKRYLAGPVMVGTIDQLLLGCLRVRHAHLRSAAMLRQLLVIDEVHASDPYMERLVGNVLDQHRASGGRALLMSATLGSAMRARLMQGSGRAALPDLEAAKATAYPAIHWPGQIRPVPRGMPGTGKSVRIELIEDAANLADLARTVLDAARAGSRVLVIRNLVDRAKALQQAIEAAAGEDRHLLFGIGGIPAPHHARFAAEDREILDAELERRFGKAAADSHDGLVAVATQTAEQSLDIDADLLVTDLCPVDVLLQRIGRLWRHRERSLRPGADRPRALVVAPHEAALEAELGRPIAGRRLLGLGSVYPNVVAAVATRRLIAAEPDWHIPEMNRRLVETVLHPEAMRQLASALGSPWETHLQTVIGRRGAEAAIAGLNGIRWTEPLAPHPRDIDEVIRTRLGLDDRQVRLGVSVPGPFGFPVRTFRIPGWMARGLAPDAVAGEVVSDPRAGEKLRITVDGREFAYDNHGLSRREA